MSGLVAYLGYACDLMLSTRYITVGRHKMKMIMTPHTFGKYYIFQKFLSANKHDAVAKSNLTITSLIYYVFCCIYTFHIICAHHIYIYIYVYVIFFRKAVEEACGWFEPGVIFGHGHSYFCTYGGRDRACNTGSRGSWYGVAAWW